MRLEFGDDVAGFGEAVLGEFGKYLFGVDKDFEAPVGEGLQLERGDALLELDQNVLRQTDGCGFVVSLRAVFNENVHVRSGPSLR